MLLLECARAGKGRWQRHGADGISNMRESVVVNVREV